VPKLRDIPLVDASVPRTATFHQAARTLAEHGVSAIAVLGDDGRVVGLFAADDLLRGLFPRYLQELRHTAFLELEPAPLSARLEQAAADPVTDHMREAATVDLGSSAIHVAERFLHLEAGALAVVEDERFVGMLEQSTFCRALTTHRPEDPA
jgi:CBS domain-containing protein